MVTLPTRGTAMTSQGTLPSPMATNVPVAYSPERIDIGGFGEGQLVLIPPGYHFSYNLRCQVAQPIMGQLQLVLTPGGQDKDMGPSVGSRCSDLHICAHSHVIEKTQRGIW